MSVPTSLLPADARSAMGTRVPGDPAGPGRELDRVHDHVLRLLGDRAAASRVITDVAARSCARARELGESPTFETLVRLAHARLASTTATRPDADLVAQLAGEREPSGALLVRAVAAASRPGAALLDLTTRHDLELRRAAALLGLERAVATRARTEALQQVRSAVTEAGLAVDVTATLARLPVIGAPASVHRAVDFPHPTRHRKALPTSMAWLGTAAVVVSTFAGVGFGMPDLMSADSHGAPVVVAEGVTEGPAARQLATPGEDVPEGEVEQLVVRAPADQSSDTSDTSEAPEPAPEPTPSPEATPPEDAASPQPEEDEPSEEPSPEPTPEPSEDPLGQLLPTGP